MTATQAQQLYNEGVAGSPLGKTGIVGWWPLAYTASDYSGNGNNAAPSNMIYANANYATLVNLMQAANFNGATSIITMSSQTGIPLGSSPRTICGWVLPTAYPGSNDDMLVAYGTQTSSGDAFTLGIDPNGYLNSDIHASRATSSLVVPLNSWHLICGVYSSGSQETFYLDSQPPQTISYTSSSPNTLSGTFYFGTWVSGSGLNFQGSAADIQIYNAALSASQIASLYAEGIDGAPLSSGLVGWWPLNGNPNDYSASGNNGAPTNLVYNSVEYSPSANPMPAAYFNGANSYVSIPNTAILNPTGALTISGWFNINSFNNAEPAIVDKESEYGLYLWANRIEFDLSYSWNGHQTASTIFNTGTWYFVTATFDGTYQKIYLNGNLLATYNLPGSISPNSNLVGIGIGGNINTAYTFNGLISDVQIYNAPLTAQQVKQLYLQGLPMYSRVNVSIG